jgi:hypothetical protein
VQHGFFFISRRWALDCSFWHFSRKKAAGRQAWRPDPIWQEVAIEPGEEFRSALRAFPRRFPKRPASPWRSHSIPQYRVIHAESAWQATHWVPQADLGAPMGFHPIAATERATSTGDVAAQACDAIARRRCQATECRLVSAYDFGTCPRNVTQERKSLVANG